MAIHIHSWKKKHKRKHSFFRIFHEHSQKKWRVHCNSSFRAKASNLLKRWQKGDIDTSELSGKLPKNHRHSADWDAC